MGGGGQCITGCRRIMGGGGQCITGCRRILGGGGRVFIADIDTVKGQESKDELNKQYGEVKTRGK